MCGIAGIVSERLAGEQRLEPLLAGMNDLMQHRGPDQDGVVTHGAAGLATVRLAVIDPREHPYPMTSADGRHVLTYNGEIYNYRALRSELEGQGVTFRTDTDTEVLLAAYKTWGEACLSRLDGFFAFVILDRETGELFGARDRIGQKPFFYTDRPGLFAFASFLPCLQALPGVAEELDHRAILDVVELGYVLNPKTPYADVSQLPPAHAFRYRDGRFESFRYWDLKEAFLEGHELGRMAVPRLVEELDDHIRSAVVARLRSDVPLGALVSGGLDTSIVVHHMGEALGGDAIRSYSIGFEDSGYDETSHAKRIAAHVGTKHHVQMMKMEDPSRIQSALWGLGEPLADSSVLPTFLLCETARKDVTVALSGDGADELFCGYETFRADAVRALLCRLPRWPVAMGLKTAAKLLPYSYGKVSLGYKVRRFLSGYELPEAEAHYHWRALMTRAGALRAFLPDARDGIAEYEPVERFRQLDAEVAGLDLANRCSYVDLMTYLPDDILVKVDRASMAVSLEARSPFLCHRVVETAAKLPGNMKIRGRMTKLFLRWNYAKALPSSTLHRPKQGFSPPAASWLVGPLAETFQDLVTKDRMASLGLDATEVQRLYTELKEHRGDHAYKLWGLLTLAAWHELRSRTRAPVTV
ncbi:MAG: asparagine synthase (glutamine-hydrolyzing) [Acidobacteriota bacterium]